MLPTYQNAGEGENLLVPTTVEQPEIEEVPQSGWNRKNLARVATVLMVCFIVAAFALRTQVTTSPTLGSVNSPISKTNNIMRSSGSNVDKPVQPLSDIRSDSRLSPLFMSSHIDTEGLLRTFFSKYGLVGNRQTSKDKYEVPTDIQSTSEVKGDAATWAYATMYSGATCQGTTISKAGLAGQQCIPVAGFGSSSTSQAFSIDCSSGQVVLNAYTAQDCSGPVSSSSVLASSGTCYQYSSTMYENPTDSPVLDSSSSTSVIFTCGTPDLSGYDVEKMFITADDSAATLCASSSSSAYDGQMFEAVPTESCIAESLDDDNEFSVKFSHDEATSGPIVTYYFNTVSCDGSKTASADLFTDCENQNIQSGISSYAKWSYHPK